jgi:hypothetical protein
VGLLTDYFAAENDDAAGHCLLRGPKAVGLSSVEAKSLDPLVTMATLEGILTGADPMAIIREHKNGVVTQAGEDGPWIVSVRDSVVQTLVPPDSPRLWAVATQWASTEELVGAEPQGLYEFLWSFAHLAAWAQANGQRLYCWMSL